VYHLPGGSGAGELMAKCVRCGAETSGTYCGTCHGWQESVKALLATAEDDAELLRLVDGSEGTAGLRKAEVARLLNVSRAAVGQRIARARERQTKRAALELELTIAPEEVAGD
jgi:predicted DNA-binding protein (UPF0251 family)